MTILRVVAVGLTLGVGFDALILDGRYTIAASRALYSATIYLTTEL